MFLTGLEDATDQEKGFELGADDYITKPVSLNVVKARIGRVFKLSFYIEFLESLLCEEARLMLSLRAS